MMLQQLPDDTFSHTTYAYPSVRAAWSVAQAFFVVIFGAACTAA